MNNTWITSDTHFSHHNIIKFCARPFQSIQEMDDCLVSNWNETVKPQDHVYHLGDVTMLRGGKPQQRIMATIISRLNGHKRLILGNHDHFPVDAYLAAGFEKVRGTGRWLNNFLLSHYPVHPTSMGNAKGCIHGHIHDKQSPPPVTHTNKDGEIVTKSYFNACVEMTGYKPVNLDSFSVQ